MAENIIMPKLGMAMVEGTVIAWKKREGEAVKKGEGIVDISSEKIEMEVEAAADGVLLKIEVPEGGVVPYGTVLGVIGQPGELAGTASVAASAKATAESVAALAASDEQRTKAGAPAATTATAVLDRPRDGIKISPVARKMAEEAGIDYTKLTGTGPQGRITKEDVERFIQAGGEKETNAAAQVAGVQTSVAPVAGSSDHAAAAVNTAEKQPERILVSGMRKVIAERMYQSLQQSAQLTITMQADITELLQLKEKLSPEMERRYQLKLSVTDLIARAVVLSLLRHKQMNSAYVEDRIELYEEVHLGIAVALEKGLVVPVIRQAEQQTLAELSSQLKSVSARARQNQLAPEEMKGSTFTITNLGSYGVDTFTPVLNPPEAGILGVGAAKDTPVFVGDELQRRSILPLSLTFDHRVLDGAPAAAFLATVRSYLEEPHSLLV